MSRTRMSLWHAALPVLACLALTGCSSGAVDASSAASRADGGSSSAPGSLNSPKDTGPEGTQKPEKSGKPKSAASPTHVSIPSIGVNSSLMRLGLNEDGTVEVPPAEKGMTVGWYTGGAIPGERGAAVLIGHNDTRLGKAVFHDLRKIGKGADIAIRNDQGAEIHFRVTGTETVSKKAFPTEKVYGATNARTLRLITCDGAFDAQGHPVDNLIVYADRS
ncbi:class F sortase [Streptomyces sp. NBC_01221]|uniref:class F sortase n=1 Tax=unclassified Streptomyces TaxID=2593676 RepID=UPI002257706B|nr:class F sortase [Streptomyces sp. NBC_01221]MCX4790626.1 class F sortase [Streptomyces sp. NBC_01221]WSP58897.1 class F sortase [Streptomyces sp. NBC_01241]